MTPQDALVLALMDSAESRVRMAAQIQDLERQVEELKKPKPKRKREQTR